MSRASNVVQLPAFDAAAEEERNERAAREKRNKAALKRQEKRWAKQAAKAQEMRRAEERNAKRRDEALAERLVGRALLEAYELDGLSTTTETVQTILGLLVEAAWMRKAKRRGLSDSDRHDPDLYACFSEETHRRCEEVCSFAPADIALEIAMLAKQAGHLLPEVPPTSNDQEGAR